MIEFFADTKGNLTANGEFIDCFGTEEAAVNMAIRHAQNTDSLYRIYYAKY